MIDRVLNHPFDEILVPESGYERKDLSNPWAVPRPLIVDMSRAEEDLDYRPVVTYSEAVRATCAWLQD